MTKERKLAIKIWEDIKQRILAGEFDRVFSFYMRKAEIVHTEYHIDWMDSCWFCQYVRRDYNRFGDYWEHTGKGKGLGEEGCNLCPLAKAHPKYNPSDAEQDCGCMLVGSPWHTLCKRHASRKKKAKACDLIIKALKGERISIDIGGKKNENCRRSKTD